MKGGRKNLKRAAKEAPFHLQQGQSIMQVVSHRGSNLIEVMDAKGEKSLALFPAKFQKSMWIKLGNFVVVDENGRDEAAESGRKVGCIVSQILFYEQVCVLQKSSEWPEIFKSVSLDNSSRDRQANSVVQDENELNSSSDDDDCDDGLPPLEANTNRMKPVELQANRESDSDTDS
ncbi:hypothetical protein RJ640_030001 [Escallonia rubra]|uniref:S1-like domain-containing protein n=1 Tax=Escallonia rubra TaxID=112253 RepID=A0AA88U6C9_9ASTE|nr:hypothetical protein RJ640_030001 [Escallonia rubra]